MQVQPIAGPAAAEAALREGELDLVLLDTRTVLAAEAPSEPVTGLLTAAAQQRAIAAALAEAGVGAAERAALLEPARWRSA